MPGIIKKAAACAKIRPPTIAINMKKDFIKSSIY